MRGGEAAGAGGSSLSWCTVGYAGGVAGLPLFHLPNQGAPYLLRLSGSHHGSLHGSQSGPVQRSFT
jgi:hypothetical protein